MAEEFANKLWLLRNDLTKLAIYCDFCFCLDATSCFILDLIVFVTAHCKSASALESLFRLFDLMLTSVQKADPHQYVEENGNRTLYAN